MTLNQYVALFSLIMLYHIEADTTLKEFTRFLLIVMFFISNNLVFIDFWKRREK